MDHSRCPVSSAYAPFDADYLADPYPALNSLREQTPVAYIPRYDLFVVTRFEEISQVFHDRENFSSLKATSPFRPVHPSAQKILDSGFPRKPTLSNCDAPRHPKMRNAVSRCLTMRRWEKTQPAVRAYALAHVEALAKKPVADLMADLCFPVPAFAGFSLIGFPLEDIDKLKAWCGNRVLLTYGELDEAEQVKAARDLVDFWGYCQEFVAMRHREPADDLTSDLLALSAQRGDDFTTEDIVNVVYSVSLAAHETTTTAVLNGLRVLLERRDLWDQIHRDPSLIPNTVEELLRFASPTQAIRRTAKRDIELGGVTIPEGALVVMLLGAGNHDGRHFVDPESIDLKRENASDQLAFGKHWHLCLGAPLARFEYKLILELLLEHTPNMRLVEGQELVFVPNMLIRSPEALLVEPSPAV